VRDKLRSNWSVPVLRATLPEFQRTDDGTDLLAFRVAGAVPHRSVFVYLYGEDPDLIHYDLEDVAAETGEWDHAVARGSVRSVDELRAIVRGWLLGKSETGSG
jgi:hypothetical protein